MNAPAEAAVYAHAITGDPRRKSPVLAMFLSAMPGLGQIYVGYYRQGFTNALVIGTIMTLLEPAPNDVVPLMALFMAFFWLYNIVDAGGARSSTTRRSRDARVSSFPKSRSRRAFAARSSEVSRSRSSAACSCRTRSSECRSSGSRSGGPPR
jgi:TM2 domain-containing membrane protein YozV